MSFELLFPKDMFKSLDVYLRSLPGAASIAGRAATMQMANRYAAEVRIRYAVGPPPPLAEGTKQRRAQGKRTGRTPRARKFAGTQPLFRSGKLARLISIRHQLGRAQSSAAVYIQPGVRMSGGGRSEVVAAVNEFGGTWFVPIPPWARTYLRALMLGVAGTNTPVNVKGDFWLISLITIPMRPVWMPAFTGLLSRQPQEYARVFQTEFNRKMQSFRINGQPVNIVLR